MSSCESVGGYASLTCSHCRKAVENNVEQELVVEDEWGEAGRKAREEGKGTKSPDRRRPDRSPRRLELHDKLATFWFVVVVGVHVIECALQAPRLVKGEEEG